MDGFRNCEVTGNCPQITQMQKGFSLVNLRSLWIVPFANRTCQYRPVMKLHSLLAIALIIQSFAQAVAQQLPPPAPSSPQKPDDADVVKIRPTWSRSTP